MISAVAGLQDANGLLNPGGRIILASDGGENVAPFVAAVLPAVRAQYCSVP